MFPDVVVTRPSWVRSFLGKRGWRCRTIEDRMRLAIELSRRNVEEGTGGPFGAAVFELRTGRLVAPGVNLVTGAGNSVLHAEVVALMLAQRLAGRYDLGGRGMPALELVSSTEPCAMCLGAIPWSGVRRLVCGARDADARAVGFDEGDKPARWWLTFHRRGIEVLRDVCRGEAVPVLRLYSARGGAIYNGRIAPGSGNAGCDGDSHGRGL